MWFHLNDGEQLYKPGGNIPTVLFQIWMFLFLPNLFKNKVIDKCGFILMMESNYINLGVTSEILNRLILVMSAVTMGCIHVAFLRNSTQQLIAFRMDPETELR